MDSLNTNQSFLRAIRKPSPGQSNPETPLFTGEEAARWQRAIDTVAAVDLRGGKLGVAYSGGVDSSVLAAVAVAALGAENMVLLTAVSPVLARRELLFARRQAAQLGLKMIEVPSSEMDNPDFIRNDAHRCFFCRDSMFTQWEQTELSKYGVTVLAFGENRDDQARPDRPGSRAATKHRVIRPLADADLTKADIRALAKEWGLISADKPSMPCLATRIPHGQPVDAAKLRAVEAAEEVLFDLGMPTGRVRHHGDIARVELPVQYLEQIVREDNRQQLVEGIKAAGFRYVTLDLTGLQSGGFTMTALGNPAVGRPKSPRPTGDVI